MVKDSRVPEHLDTNSVVDSKSLARHDTLIFVKWRPSGKSNNRHTAARNPPIVLRSRDPVSLGDLKGAFHLSGSLSEPKQTNDRSSRRGNEQTRLKSSTVVEVM